MKVDESQGFLLPHFYRAFEEQYYAPREVIKNIRKQYLPFVKPLIDLYPQGQTLDCGCGRGEWLELMVEQGLTPFGVDLDQGLLEDCYRLNLPASHGDAIQYIRQLPDESQVLVSAFHVVEHLSFNDLQVFIQEALRVLKPAGLLIIELPNIENLRVASSYFYLDPTHLRPLPIKLLAFLTDTFGFARTKVMRLQERPGLLNSEDMDLLSVIINVSPDCGVVAQKLASGRYMQLFDDVFSQKYGISLEEIAQKYEDCLRQREARNKKENEDNLRQLEAKIEQLRNITNQLTNDLNRLYNSKSWRLTAPFRWVAQRLFQVKASAKQAAKLAIKPLLAGLVRFVIAHDSIKNFAIKVIRKYPRLDNRLRQFALNRGLLSQHYSPPIAVHAGEDAGLQIMTPAARAIYGDLKDAIAKTQKAGND